MRAECSGEQLSAQKAFGSRDAWSSLRSEQFEMKATVMYAAGDVRVEHVPDPRLIEPTDAIVRITLACICGSDLWPYKKMKPSDRGQRMGHEFIGLVEDIGAAVRTVKRGDVVVAPFLWSDGTCVFCHEGLHTSCLHGGRWGGPGVDAGQGEAVRVPQADGTLVVLQVGRDDARMRSLLALSDVMGTGHHAALAARVAPGKTVAVVGAARLVCAASSPSSDSAQSESSCLAVTPTGSLSRASLGRRTL